MPVFQGNFRLLISLQRIIGNNLSIINVIVVPLHIRAITK